MIDEIIFRPMRKEDALQIHQVALEAWKFTYRDIFEPQFIQNFVNRNYAPEVSIRLLPRVEAGQIFFHVSVSKNTVFGFCNIGETPQGMELFRIYLHPSYIGKGIGRKLLELGEDFVRSKGYNTYFCFVHKDNKIGKNFYVKAGFTHIPKKDQDVEWYMEKLLM